MEEMHFVCGMNEEATSQSRSLYATVGRIDNSEVLQNGSKNLRVMSPHMTAEISIFGDN